MTNVRASVCIAAYNGAKYILEQIESIMLQLGGEDELIVYDDNSTDNTFDLLTNLHDPRVRIYRNSVNLGHVKNFEQCIKKSRGKYIILSDQDDLWVSGRLEIMLHYLSSYNVVVGNFLLFHKKQNNRIEICGRDISSISSRFRIINIIYIYLGLTPYYGAVMGFTNDVKTKYIPFPKYVESHDVWLALLGNMRYKIVHINNVLLKRRLHLNNLTPRMRRSIIKIARTRVYMLILSFIAIVR